MSRPSKLTPQVRDTLIAAVKAGAYREDAAAAAGIHAATFYRWMQRGQEADAPAVYREFCEALTRAEREAQVYLIATIKQAAPTDWRAAVELLRMRWPEKYSERWRAAHEMGPIQVEIGHQTREQEIAEADARVLRLLPGRTEDAGS